MFKWFDSLRHYCQGQICSCESITVDDSIFTGYDAVPMGIRAAKFRAKSESETSEIHCPMRQRNTTEERNLGHTASKSSKLDISISGEHQNVQRTVSSDTTDVSADTTYVCPPTPQIFVLWHHRSVSSNTTVLCPLTPQFCVPWHHRLVSPDTTDLCPPTPQFCDRWHHNFAVNTSLFTNNFLSV